MRKLKWENWWGCHLTLRFILTIGTILAPPPLLCWSRGTYLNGGLIGRGDWLMRSSSKVMIHKILSILFIDVLHFTRSYFTNSILSWQYRFTQTLSYSDVRALLKTFIFMARLMLGGATLSIRPLNGRNCYNSPHTMWSPFFLREGNIVPWWMESFILGTNWKETTVRNPRYHAPQHGYTSSTNIRFQFMEWMWKIVLKSVLRFLTLYHLLLL